MRYEFVSYQEDYTGQGIISFYKEYTPNWILSFFGMLPKTTYVQYIGNGVVWRELNTQARASIELSRQCFLLQQRAKYESSRRAVHTGETGREHDRSEPLH